MVCNPKMASKRVNSVGLFTRRLACIVTILGGLTAPSSVLYAQDAQNNQSAETKKADGEDTKREKSDTGTQILTVPVAPRQRGEGEVPYKSRVELDMVKPKVTRPDLQQDLVPSDLVLELRSTYIVTSDGDVISLADWALSALERSELGVDMMEAERDVFLGNLARAALGQGPVSGSTGDLNLAKPFGPPPSPINNSSSAIRFTLYILAQLAPGFADDRPRLVRERSQRIWDTQVRAIVADDLPGLFAGELSLHADNARKESSNYIPEGLERPEGWTAPDLKTSQ